MEEVMQENIDKLKKGHARACMVVSMKKINELSEITSSDIAIIVLLKQKFNGNIPLFNSYEIGDYKITCDGNSMPLNKFIEDYTEYIIEIFKECLYEK